MSCESHVVDINYFRVYLYIAGVGVCLSKMIVESMQVKVVQAHDENGQQTYLQFLTICFG
jgi:hypothetical protein